MFTATCAIVLLCGIGFTAAVTFDWIDVQSKLGDTETIADFSQLQISSFEADDGAIHYVNGPLTFKQELDESYNVHYSLLKKNEQSQMYEVIPDIPEETVNVCVFVKQFFRSYMLPLTKFHNDFPPRGSECPVEGGIYHIFPVENRTQLNARSGLKPSEYKVEFVFQKDDADIGGFSGRFVSKDD